MSVVEISPPPSPSLGKGGEIGEDNLGATVVLEGRQPMTANLLVVLVLRRLRAQPRALPDDERCLRLHRLRPHQEAAGRGGRVSTTASSVASGATLHQLMLLGILQRRLANRSNLVQSIDPIPDAIGAQRLVLVADHGRQLSGGARKSELADTIDTIHQAHLRWYAVPVVERRPEAPCPISCAARSV